MTKLQTPRSTGAPPVIKLTWTGNLPAPCPGGTGDFARDCRITGILPVKNK